jgi:hypothetical protein
VFAGVDAFGIYTGQVATALIDPNEQPFLFDHQIDGTPVLPGVMGVECFAEAATLLHPELAVEAVEAVEFLAPFKFYRHEPRTVEVNATFRLVDDRVVADCVLIGERILANQAEPQVTEHFRGRVVLGPKPPKPSKTTVPGRGEPVATADDIYRIYFHGPAYQVLDEAWAGDGGVVGRMAADLPPNHVPEDGVTVTWPRLAELAFQASGIWEIGTTGTMALPASIDRVVFARDPRKAKGRILAVVAPGDGAFDVRVCDEEGRTYVVMEGYRTVALPTALPDEQVAPLRQAATGKD